MGCGIDYLLWLCEEKILKPGMKVLDIGESCLLSNVDDEDNKNKIKKIIEYLKLSSNYKFKTDEFESFISNSSYRSSIIGHPTTPTLFLGDIFKVTSIQYTSIDICSARYAQLFDINIHSLNKKYYSNFDIVLNFGTTEHILNQYNCFKIMHESLKLGGIMHAQIPGGGGLTMVISIISILCF